MRKGQRHRQESKDMMSASHAGVTLSQETRAALSIAKIGNRNGIGNKNRLGRKATNETIRRLSESHKGVAWGVEARANHMESMRHSNHGKKYYHDLDMWFRSGWEYKVAKWLNEQGWRWIYEEITYYVAGFGSYTPDFHVYVDAMLWKVIEVKGRWIRDSKDKSDAFAHEYPDLPYEIWDGIKLKSLGIL